MKALVLSGGGSKGSWQAGALAGLAQIQHHKTPHKPELGYQLGFDFISGTSVGAINAAGIAMFPKQGFMAAADFLGSLWTSKRLKIWRLRFPPYLSGLWNPSFGVNSGLKAFLRKAVDVDRVKRSGVKLSLSAVNLETGEIVRFTETADNLRKAILASSSFPLAFPPEEINGQLYTDGGVRDIVPLSPAIKAGATEVTIIATENPHEVSHIKADKLKTVKGVSGRILDLLTAEILKNDIMLCHSINESLDCNEGKRPIKIRLIYPSSSLGDSLDFKRSTMREQYTQGIQDAMKALS